MKKFRIKVNGQEYEVEVEEIGQEKPSQGPSPKSFSSQPSAGNGNIVAPMPGVVTAVKIKAGDLVRSEQPLLTLEAMKMENEIPADRSGVVKEVLVKEGQGVGAGELLVVIV
ncbi:Biotin/lipoyl attachment [Acididesulfobacillus acetoxydans]|uniref:Biotin/lipoyl attachment n=2 Tax=Acididesulfobacillus acetoxydans TaxID=1561005 RepID=A0A8S0VXD5_9FIRM|nr:biotin/lipoyl-containing protein [Acididesulfobacillus acetoxydans]CAA7601813.1 Biotin/lipoyl attachment [Acididesulfobacillus acetoxydans]CEJ09233.1 Single hybrid motif [Acididesulfobacillus acetoxydans]